jgi:hypothetical protein
MAQLVEINQVGKREDLRDFISLIDMKDKPLLAMIPKLPDQMNMLVTWQADLYSTPQTSGVADGVDVTTFENAAANRAPLQVYGQKFRRTAMVGDLAENVSHVAGAKSGELARSLDKKLEELARDIEATFCSDNGTVLETSEANPYKTRGLGLWIADGVNLAVDTVLSPPASFRTPAAQVDVTAGVTNITESGKWIPVLESLFKQYGKSDNLVALCGTGFKKQVTSFTATQFGSTNTSQALRMYSAPLTASGTTVINNVTSYAGDFNTVDLHPSLLLKVNTAASPNTPPGNPDRCYIFPPAAIGMAYNRPPTVTKLPNLGGGPRAMVEAIACLIVRNPLGLAQFRPS